MLGKRILTAVVGIPILLFVTYHGRAWLVATLVLLTVCGTREMLGLYEKEGFRPFADAAYFSSIALLMASAAPTWLPVILSGCITYTLTRELADGRRRPLFRPAATMLTALYIGWSFGHIYRLRSLEPDGFKVLILTLLATWITDSAAYFVGCSLGRCKLAPSISPTKSIEGAIGGFVFAVLLTPVIGRLLGIGLGESVIIGLIAAVIGQIGDLIESSMKRQAKVKDSGSLFPGHGGLLDRFDSLIMVVPVVYYIIRLVRGLV